MRLLVAVVAFSVARSHDRDMWSLSAHDDAALTEAEEYLEPYLEDLVVFRDNPIAKRFITLANLVDVVPTWLVDLFVPLIIPDSTLDLAMKVDLPIPDPTGTFDGIPPTIAHLQINRASLSNLNEFKKLKPIKFMDNTRFTWAGEITWKEEAQTQLQLGAKLVVAEAFDVGLNISVTVKNPRIDFAAVMAFDREKMCNVWGHVLQSSLGCAMSAMFVNTHDRVSGVRLASLGLQASDFSVDSIEVAHLPKSMHKFVDDMLKTFIEQNKALILEHMSDKVSEGALKAINGAIFDEIKAIQKFYPCELDSVTPVPQASRVCFSNNAAFVMKWGYANCPTHEVSLSTKPFPIGQSECLDVQDIWPDAQAGQVLRATTEAVAGMHEIIDPAIRYAPDSNTATFACDGTTLSYKCKLISVVPVDPLSPIQASRVCVLNQAAFVLHYDVQNLRTEQWLGQSGNFPVTTKKCIDLSAVDGLKDGDQLQAQVHAVAGKDYRPKRIVEYSADAFEVTFVCKGTTLNFKCEAVTGMAGNGTDSENTANSTTEVPDDENATSPTTESPDMPSTTEDYDATTTENTNITTTEFDKDTTSTTEVDDSTSTTDDPDATTTAEETDISTTDMEEDVTSTTEVDDETSTTTKTTTTTSTVKHTTSTTTTTTVEKTTSTTDRDDKTSTTEIPDATTTTEKDTPSTIDVDNKTTTEVMFVV